MKEGNNQSKIPRILILTPVHNEEQSLPIYENTVNEILLSHPDYVFEVLLIDDGSTDQSWEIICRICNKNNRFRGVRLSRNYGSHMALSAGFAHADADAVAILACDLQDPPTVILKFLEKWRSGARIVWGRRRTRGDEGWRILASNLFYRAIRRFAMPARSKFTTGSFLLADRQVVDCIQQFHERNRVTFALVAWTGFNQAVVDYDRQPRLAGHSGWSFQKMLKAMYDTFIGFSFLPIRIITISGIAVSFLTIPLGIYTLVSWLLGDPLPGWTSLMLALLLLFGIQFLMIGVVGEYLYRIYSEVVGRPLYFISEKTGFSKMGFPDGS